MLASAWLGLSEAKEEKWILKNNHINTKLCAHGSEAFNKLTYNNINSPAATCS